METIKAVKEIPMLFKTEMVKAILSDTKTETRRLVKASFDLGEYQSAKMVMDSEIAEYDKDGEIHPKLIKGLSADFDDGEWVVKSPYNVGDVIWVKETYTSNGLDYFRYKADWPEGKGLFDNCDGKNTPSKWKSSMFMPKKAARIFLEITEIGIERLHEITDEECIKEGIQRFTKDDILYKYGVEGFDWKWTDFPLTPKDAFKKLWVQINGQESWDDNPWIWCVKFKKLNDYEKTKENN